MSKIVAVRKDEEGRITQVKMDDGKVMSHDEAVTMADAGRIDGVSTFTNRAGETSMRSDRGQDDYALSRLPEF